MTPADRPEYAGMKSYYLEKRITNVVLVLVIAAVVALFVHHWRRWRACEAQGGVYAKSFSGYECLRRPENPDAR